MSSNSQTVADDPSVSEISLQDDCRKLIALEQEAEATKNAAKEAAQKLDVQRRIVAERMTFDGVSKLGVDGRTVFPRTTLFAKTRFTGLSNSDIESLLNDHGLASLLKATVNAQSFGSAVREMVNQARENDESLVGQSPELALPETLRAYVHCYEETKACVRKG